MVKSLGPTLNFEGDPGVPLLNFEGNPRSSVSGFWCHFYAMLVLRPTILLNRDFNTAVFL